MENDYKIAEISPACVSEINALQDKIREQTNEDIILVAYETAKED